VILIARVGFTAALSRVWYWALLAGAYSLLPMFLAERRWWQPLNLAPLMDAVIAFALGILLLFRMNRAYDRWWEARTLWGTLVNVSRNLAIKARELARPGPEDRALTRKLIVGFCYALKHHLTDGGHLRDVPDFQDTERDPDHVPSYLSGRIYALLQRWRAEGRIGDADMWMLDREARVLMDVCGGCEKIKNTLPSQSFPVLVRQALVLYLLYLPWSFAPDFGIWAFPIAIAIAYFIIATEGIAFYVERPFGDTEDHLDLKSICVGIDMSVTEVLSVEAST
jgi:putative membrane protein